MANEVFRLVGRIVMDGVKKVQDSIKEVGKEAEKMRDSMGKVGDTVSDTAKGIGKDMGDIGDSVQDVEKRYFSMRKTMRDAYREQRKELRKFKIVQMENKLAWFEMGRATKDYQGTTQDFMKDVKKLGNEHKKITDLMKANNRLALGDFYRSVGTMLARSAQSEKIAENFDRMNNPIYKVNKGLLEVSGSLEKLAKAGMPAVQALKMLGPTANMKQLGDMTRLISQGQMRFAAVLLASAIAVGTLTKALAKASFGPDPKEVRSQMNELNSIYKEALNERKEEIYQWAGLFEEVEFKVPDPSKLLKNLGQQVNIMKTWMKDLKVLTERGVDEGLIAELQKMGPKASGEIHALTKMTDKQLDEYVALWGEKQGLATEQATSELEEMRKMTEEQIQKLRDSLEPLGLSVEKFKETWAEALEPFVESFGEVASKVVDAGTAIGEFFKRLNDINPMITTVIGWFGFIFLALTMLLAPLAIGIGLIGGFASAWAFIAPFVMPLIAGLASMAGTIALVTGAILLAIGIISLFVKSFKNWIAGSEEAQTAWANFTSSLKEKYEQFVEPIKELFSQVMDTIKEAVKIALEEIQGFWETYGTQILEAVDNFLGFLLDAWNFVFPIIKFIVEGVIGAIIDIFNGFVDIVMGIVQIFTGLFTGDWALLWEGLKTLVWGAIQVIWGWINLSFFGKILKGIGGFVTGAVKGFTGFWTGVVTGFQGMITKVVTWFTKLGDDIFRKWNEVRTFTGGIFSGIRTTLTTIWEGIWTAIKTKVGSILTTIKTNFDKAKTAITTPIETAKKTLLGIIDNIKGAFDKMKITIPKPKIPSVAVGVAYKTIAGIKIPYPDFDVSWKATGGIFDSPEIIGVGEAGREAVVPLEGRQVRPFAEEVAKLIPNSYSPMGGVIETAVYLDGREIARAITPQLNQSLERERRITNRGRGIQP